MKKKVAILIEPIRGYERQIMLGIARYAREHRNWLFYLDKEDPFYKDFISGRTNIGQRLREWGVDGIITRHPEKLKIPLKNETPIVVVKETLDQQIGWNKISLNNQAIGQMAADHLLERGFKNFGYCGLQEMFWSRARGDTFAQKIAQSRGSTSVYQQPRALKNLSWAIEQNVLADWLKSLTKPAAVMACNDDRAEHVIEACRLADIIVPEEVAVIGVDNDELICEFSNPPLSSVALNGEQAGLKAAGVLDSLMQGRRNIAAEILVEPTSVVTRQSTDVMAIEDRDVARAIAYIRENVTMDTSAQSVSENVSVSLRSLEKKFRKTLGWSVRAELKRARINTITEMLLETDLSISEIASKLKYANDHNMARFFRKEMDITPLVFRKKHRV
jgi:LacI family transcriptional regulator